MAGVKGQDQGRAIGQIHLIDYNFASNCHRDFKLGSYLAIPLGDAIWDCQRSFFFFPLFFFFFFRRDFVRPISLEPLLAETPN